MVYLDISTSYLYITNIALLYLFIIIIVVYLDMSTSVLYLYITNTALLYLYMTWICDIHQ